MYPCGNGVAKDQYLSVFLEQVQGVQDGSRYEYKIHMLNFTDSYHTLIREFVSEFNTDECWGYIRFYKLDNLQKDGFITNNDTVHILNLDYTQILCQTSQLQLAVPRLINLHQTT